MRPRLAASVLGDVVEAGIAAGMLVVVAAAELSSSSAAAAAAASELRRLPCMVVASSQALAVRAALPH